ncbi:hypothetical protein [Virgisporangium aurantiacum]|uniref:Uncharacterized protein n=1 Tax=Virgisporangium aurantiacum TaxID=175570 RepID=A0A8J3ZDR4_9ACTN|nr:hypothetical protein [Virgisporangium aurantiacum]GIJ62084.1 hypothetical protein Vau01_096000 [Virgisporangium aurantiacum]
MTGRRRRFAATRPDPTTQVKAPRQPALPAGQLRAMVLAHLRAHPHLDFTDTDLANVFNRPQSRGAIRVICKTLMAQGLAVQTRQRPQRYRAAPDGSAQPQAAALPPPHST